MYMKHCRKVGMYNVYHQRCLYNVREMLGPKISTCENPGLKNQLNMSHGQICDLCKS